jgi:hypothetical protein
LTKLNIWWVISYVSLDDWFMECNSMIDLASNSKLEEVVGCNSAELRQSRGQSKVLAWWATQNPLDGHIVTWVDHCWGRRTWGINTPSHLFKCSLSLPFVYPWLSYSKSEVRINSLIHPYAGRIWIVVVIVLPYFIPSLTTCPSLNYIAIYLKIHLGI